MIIKYENIEINITGEINIKENIEAIKSLIRGKYYDINNIILNDNDITEDTINYIGKDTEEEIIITKEINKKNSDFIYGKIYNTDPKINSNVITGDGLYIWVNKITGEIFMCIDNTHDKNVWVGQFGTKVIGESTINNSNENGNMIFIGMNLYDGSYLLNILGARIAKTKNISYSNGLINKSVYFKSNSEVFILDSESTNFTGDFTISYLIKPKSVYTYQTHLEKQWNNEFCIYQDNTGKVGMTFGDGQDYKNTLTQTKLIYNRWNHVKIIKSGSIVIIELNSNPTPVISSVPNTFDMTSIPKTTNPIKIGYGSFGNFIGYMEEVILFNYAISSEASSELTQKYSLLL